MSTSFRILTGSYEHNLLCLSLLIPKDDSKTAVFQPIFHFESHSLSIYTLASSKRYLVTGSKDEHIKIYDLKKRKELGDLLAHEGSINTLKFSDNGKWLLSGSSDHSIVIWRVQDWDVFGKLKGHKDCVNDLDIHPSSRIAISCSNDNTLRLWNLMTAKKAAVLKLKYNFTKAQKPQFIRWSLTGDFFVVCLSTRILIYETSSSKIVKIVDLKSPIMRIEMYMMEKEYMVLGLGNASVLFYDFAKIVESREEKEEEIKEKEKEKVEDEDEEKEEKENKYAELISDQQEEFKLLGHTNRVKDFKIYKPEGSEVTYFVSVSSDGKIVVWDLEKKEQIAIYDAGERLNCVEVVADSVEKVETMKKRTFEEDSGFKTESEYETDGEESKKIMFGGQNKKKRIKKKAKKSKEKAVVEIE